MTANFTGHPQETGPGTVWNRIERFAAMAWKRGGSSSRPQGSAPGRPFCSGQRGPLDGLEVLDALRRARM